MGTVDVSKLAEARAAGGKGGGTLMGGGMAASASILVFIDLLSRRKSSLVYPDQSTTKFDKKIGALNRKHAEDGITRGFHRSLQHVS